MYRMETAAGFGVYGVEAFRCIGGRGGGGGGAWSGIMRSARKA